MDRGYAATSIDDVARSLGATKGRIYHHYRSKADLFFDVYRHGMQMNFDIVAPIAEQSLPTIDKLQRMTKEHCLAMIRTQPFQRCVWEGVEMLKRGATTPEQRDVLIELQAMRDNYADIFRAVIEQAKAEGTAQFESSSIALQLMFMSLNSPLFWFRRRDGQDNDIVDEIANQCAIFALRGLGLKEELITDV
ncbi:MAG: TetR/AcrR family transcriptional regulator [Hyphomicrobiales bacterium]|nr:TetR/AcrR family transcriptional regulator [Hyphomicrobiales bacterium]